MPRACLLPATLWLALAAFGCATRQQVALDCVPREMTVYVDGRALDPGTASVALEKDRPHTLYFKGEGYETQMVVMESGDAGLSPAEVCSHTAFQPIRPSVQMQLEDEP